MIDFIVMIPARYASHRLPGKPLRDIGGKPMLQHVFERASESDARRIIVATDDERIASAAQEFGADICMTSAQHASGTERLAEACQLLRIDPDQIVVNLQGDEPLMPAAVINECARLLSRPDIEMATLASPFDNDADFRDPNIVKVVCDGEGFALYFSRAPIPYSRSSETNSLALETARQHHGIYSYRAGVLQRLVKAPPAASESCERLEQLRALHTGVRIKVGHPSVRPGPGVDTEEDLDAAERLLRSSGDSN